MNENNVIRLAELFGSKARLAKICDVHPTAITKWMRSGEVPSRHHRRIKREAWLITAGMTDMDAAQKLASDIMKCLPSTICPCCGREI